MGKTFFKSLFLLALFLIVPELTSATVIFQDNFDNCTSNCTSAQSTGPSGWGQWYQWDGYQATVGGVTHYSGEISSPGRGGGGKSLKTWRAGQYWENYTGSLIYYPPSSLNEFYMRYYVKLPTEFDLSRCSGSNYLKLWRLNLTGSINEMYLNLNQEGGSLRNTGSLQIATSISGWTTVLSHSELLAIWDGNWHSWEWHFNPSAGLLELWIDGVRKYSGSSFNFGGGSVSMMQHFSMGNHATGCSWQSSWQAMDIDDFVLSPTDVGADGNGGGTTPPPTDTTPPVISNPQPSATLGAGTVSTTMRVTTTR